MDNRQIDITSEGDCLVLALTLAVPNAPGSKATDYKVFTHKGIPTLLLLWHTERDSTPFAYPHTLDQLIPFVNGWLASVDYGREPDHDGDNGKGWRVFTEAWGHVADHHYAIVAIQPAWAMYGK